MEPIYPFVLTGFMGLHGATSCWRMLNASFGFAPMWASSQAGKIYLGIAALVSLVVLVVALWFGFAHFSWWVPLLFFVLAILFSGVVDGIGGSKGVIISAIIFPVLTIVASIWLVASW